MKNFINDLSNSLNSNNMSKVLGYEYHDLMKDDLTIDGTKITTKFRDSMLAERNNILQDYAHQTDDLYYVYSVSMNKPNSYNLANYVSDGTHLVITKSISELPTNCMLGAVLRKQNNSFVIDAAATKIVGKAVNSMIKEKILEQDKYLNSQRINGHTYEVAEKYNNRVILYDLDIPDGSSEIEEIDFPKDLYDSTKEGDLFIYHDGKYCAKDSLS